MDYAQILKELYAERDGIDAAIVAMEQLGAAQSGAKKRGRPPAWLKEAREKAKDKAEG